MRKMRKGKKNYFKEEEQQRGVQGLGEKGSDGNLLHWD